MAGTIVADQLQDGAGNSTSMDNAIYGSAKAWVNYKGTSTQSIRASYNVSSVTRNGTGDYTINFTNALTDANYAVSGVGGNNDSSAGYVVIYQSGGQAGTYSPTTSACRILVGQNNGTLVDNTVVCVTILR
jgi:hypothetical protein